MPDPFVHLSVASGYSLRYGASLPEALVARAADHGMDTLALTDRDGVYGAVKFAQACSRAGIRPVFGADLAVLPSAGSSAGSSTGSSGSASRRGAPARGGFSVDPRHSRVTLLAKNVQGWGQLCRLISATHLRGERGSPVTTLELIGEYAAEGDLFVLLGPSSEIAGAVNRRRPDLAREILGRWQNALGDARSNLRLDVASWRGPDDTVRAARMLGFATEERVGTVLTNAVRYADAADAPVADVLDAARRLVALDERHVDRVNAEGFLKSGKEMLGVADEIARLAGAGTARQLLAATRAVADQCAVDPRADLGLGEVHFPELGVLDSSGLPAGEVLRRRCEAGIGRRGMPGTRELQNRLDAELSVISSLGYPSYFLTVADVVDLIRDMGVRVAARGSGAGSLVNYLLGISGVDPLRHGLLMERFLSPLRSALPDIDLDVESDRRTEVYQRVFDRFGAERTTCVSMMDTYRVRHAIRDVGAALGLPPGEIDSLAKAFPHVRARSARAVLRELPELRASGIAGSRLDLLFSLVERLDGLPRHIALHPCGVLLSDASLLARTPVEASWLGFPMSQFDKDDVEELGLLKLDLLGIRMQSAMAHATAEILRVDGAGVDLDAVPLDDPATFELIASTRTLGCFQIESPGQRELVGKFAPETFNDLIVDISLFRPGPVKSDMVTPFLSARQGWKPPRYLSDDLRPILEETCGVVVFHEQVLQIVSITTGCSLAEADEVRRGLGEPESQAEVEVWFRPRALARGYPASLVDSLWEVLKAFGSFGFCKAHAAAFALPTYQSAWLKAHHPAAFFAGILTADPGMYPKRLILDDARQFGICVLPLDVNYSADRYLVEVVEVVEPPAGELPVAAGPASRYGIRISLADVKGISEAEIAGILAGRPYSSLAEFWQRASVSRPVAERLVLAGALDSVHPRAGRLTRRDLLLQLAELDAGSRAARRSAPPRRRGDRVTGRVTGGLEPGGDADAAGTATARYDVRALAARQRQDPAPIQPVDVQLPLFDDAGTGSGLSGLPEMTDAERVAAELEVLGLDVTCHVLDFYAPLLSALGVTRGRDLLRCRSSSEVLIAGVKVATQTPPVRSGKRIIFLTLDDATGPIDATFFEDAQLGYATTLFHSWLLLVRGVIRRTGPRGISVRATGCWELPGVHARWRTGGFPAVQELLDTPAVLTEAAVAGAAASRSSRPVMVSPPVGGSAQTYEPRESSAGSGAGGMTSGKRARLDGMGRLDGTGRLDGAGSLPGAGPQSARPDEPERPRAPRKLWHSSSGSTGG